jgi:hypothetical protein
MLRELRSLRNVAHGVIVLFLIGLFAHAQQTSFQISPQDQPSDRPKQPETKKEKRGSLIAAPIPISSPARLALVSSSQAAISFPSVDPTLYRNHQPSELPLSSPTTERELGVSAESSTPSRTPITSRRFISAVTSTTISSAPVPNPALLATSCP